MKVLFIVGVEIKSNLGGVERVTAILTNFFLSKGIEVSYLYYGIGAISNLDFHTNINVYFLPDLRHLKNDENINFLSQLVKTTSIDIVIQQGAITTIVSKLILKSLESLDVKVISILHNTPFSYSLNRSILKNQIRNKNFTLKNIIKQFFFEFYSFRDYYRYKKFFKMSYESCNVFLLLSKSYYPLLCKILNKTELTKLMVMPNPLSYEVESSYQNLLSKENQVLFVGRLEYSQKRIDRLIYAWSLIENDVADWKLLIVGGDGGKIEEVEQRNEQKRLEDIVKKLGLKNITFSGQQIPKFFYENSKIFCLTSSYEGFPMVLGEAMQHGVVPVAFGSFDSVYDIITNEKNGIIVEPFDIETFAIKIKELILNDEKRQQMAIDAIESSQKYSLEIIGNIWIKLFDNLVFDK